MDKLKLRTTLSKLLGDYEIPKNALIAGGSVANIILNQLTDENLPINDIDVFIPNGIPTGEVSAYSPYATKFSVRSIQENDIVQLIYIDINENLNWTNTIWALLQTFHLNCVQIAYDWHNDELYYTQEFELFLEHRKILFNPLTYHNLISNIMKAYKKHKEGVGYLSNDYLLNTMGGTNFLKKTAHRYYKELAEKMVHDPVFSFEEEYKAWYKIPGQVSENPIAQIAYQNELAIYGNTTPNSRWLYSKSEALYLILTTIDLTWVRNKPDRTQIEQILLGESFRSINTIGLTRIVSVPAVLQLLTLVKNKPKLYLLSLGKCLLGSNNINNIQALLREHQIQITTILTPKMFTPQIVTIKDAMVYDSLELWDIKAISEGKIYINVGGYVLAVNTYNGTIDTTSLNIPLIKRHEILRSAIAIYLAWYRLARPRGENIIRANSEADIPF